MSATMTRVKALELRKMQLKGREVSEVGRGWLSWRWAP